MLGLCKQVTSAVNNGIGWEPRNSNVGSNADNRDNSQQPNIGQIHQATADNKNVPPDSGVTSTAVDNDDGFSHKYLNNNANGAVHINIPNSVNEASSNDKIRIPQEKFKTFVGKYYLD